MDDKGAAAMTGSLKVERSSGKKPNVVFSFIAEWDLRLLAFDAISMFVLCVGLPYLSMGILNVIQYFSPVPDLEARRMLWVNALTHSIFTLAIILRYAGREVSECAEFPGANVAQKVAAKLQMRS